MASESSQRWWSGVRRFSVVLPSFMSHSILVSCPYLPALEHLKLLTSDLSRMFFSNLTLPHLYLSQLSTFSDVITQFIYPGHISYHYTFMHSFIWCVLPMSPIIECKWYHGSCPVPDTWRSNWSATVMPDNEFSELMIMPSHVYFSVSPTRPWLCCRQGLYLAHLCNLQHLQIPCHISTW